MARLVSCQNCGKHVSTSLSHCPNCGARQRRPLKTVLIVLAVLAAIFIFLLNPIISEASVNSREAVKQAEEREKYAQAVFEELMNEPIPTHGIGETAELRRIRATLRGIHSSKGSGFNKPKDGNVFLVYELEIENGSDKELIISSITLFTAYADDYALEGDLFGPDNDTPLEGRLAPGKKKRGVVTFQAPEGWQTTELHFKPNLWADGEIVFAATNDEVQP